MYQIARNWLKVFIESHRGKKFILRIEMVAQYSGEFDYYNKYDIEVLVDASSRYIGIWIRENRNGLENNPWILYSYHDSCWRTDGLRWVFDYWLKLRNYMTALFIPIGDANNSIKIEPGIVFFTEIQLAWKFNSDNGRPDSDSIIILPK